VVWEEHGQEVLQRLPKDEPIRLANDRVRLVASRRLRAGVGAAIGDPEQRGLLVGIARTMKETAPDASTLRRHCVPASPRL